MEELTSGKKKLLLTVGIIVLIEAIVMFVLIFTGKSDLPLFIPIPLTISAACLLFIGFQK